MSIDFGSFIIGAVVAFAISFVLYKRRDLLSAVWQKIRAKAQDLKNKLTASVEQRYTDALLAYCDQLIVAGRGLRAIKM